MSHNVPQGWFRGPIGGAGPPESGEVSSLHLVHSERKGAGLRNPDQRKHVAPGVGQKLETGSSNVLFIARQLQWCHGLSRAEDR